MSTKTKSIFSGMSGLIAALAGLVTVAVGVLTLGSQLGWFDGKSGSGKSGSGNATTAGDDQSSSGGEGSAAATAPPSFTLDPRTIDFKPGQPTEKVVTLTNKGTEPFTPRAPDIEGDTDEFRVSDVSCAGTRLQPRSSCQVKVQFSATQLGNYNADVVIPISGSDLEAKVGVVGEKGLL